MQYAKVLAPIFSVFCLAACGGSARTDSAASNSPNSIVAAETSSTARFTGNRANYSIAATSSTYTVTDNVGSDGTLPVSNVQSLVFADVTINTGIGAKAVSISSANLATLVELYIAFFNRVPDADGLSYWIDQFNAGRTIPQIAESFYSAAIQYSSLTGYSASMSNEDFVRIIYRNVLGRTGATEPPAADVSYWANNLATGADSRGSLVSTMLNSAHSFRGDATWGWVASLLDNKTAVGKYFAVQQGLNYNSSTDSVTNTMAIAAAVTSSTTSSALSLIGISDSAFNLVTVQTPAALTFTTLAGSASAVSRSVDSTGTAAQFYSPRGVTVDGSGNVYVADSSNNTIRKITPAGVVTTFAGTAGSQGLTNGTGSAARFTDPYGIAVDSGGNLYIADTSNNAIRKITSAGVVTTLAGGGAQGSTDGTGTSARFSEPRGVAVDSSGNVYVADYGNSTIRKITSAGVVTTLAGTAGSVGSTDGSGTAARFRGPNGIAVDSSGNVYVADTDNRTIRKITSAGVVTTLAGSATSSGSTDGTGTAARFAEPRGVTVDAAGTLYVVDYDAYTIRQITSAGVVTTFAGTAAAAGSTDATGTAARFYSPTGVTVDSSGNVYVADTSNNTIRKITSAGVVTTLAGLAGRSSSVDATGTSARFEDPYATAVDNAGNVYVADATDHTIRKITPAGVVTTLAGSAGSFGSTDGTGTAARFWGPQGIAVDGAGTVYVADTNNNTIRKITPAGVVTTLAGSAGSGGATNGTGTAARFSGPNGIAVDNDGNLYVADTNNNTIRKITSAGVVTTLAGSTGSTGFTNGTGTAARFSVIFDVAVDLVGNVYVCDHGNHAIRKITPAGVVTTLAGSGTAGSSDGTGTAASFRFPSGVTVDGWGNVYVADTDNQLIRRITPAGVVTTVGGSASGTGSTDAAGTSARFFNPKDVAADRNGVLYIADRGNHTIRKGS
jgi:streptogramin lyase